MVFSNVTARWNCRSLDRQTRVMNSKPSPVSVMNLSPSCGNVIRFHLRLDWDGALGNISWELVTRPDPVLQSTRPRWLVAVQCDDCGVTRQRAEMRFICSQRYEVSQRGGTLWIWSDLDVWQFQFVFCWWWHSWISCQKYWANRHGFLKVLAICVASTWWIQWVLAPPILVWVG